MKILIIDADPRFSEIIKYVVTYHFNAETTVQTSLENLGTALKDKDSFDWVIVESAIAAIGWARFLRDFRAAPATTQLMFCGDELANDEVASKASALERPVA